MKMNTKLIIYLSAALFAATLASAEKPKASTPAPVEKVKAYPLTVCVVSGEKLGAMGKPYVHTYKGVEIQFCCKGCLAKFNKSPDSYLAKVKQAEAEAAKP